VNGAVRGVVRGAADRVVARYTWGQGPAAQLARRIGSIGVRDVNGNRVRLREINPGYNRDPERRINCMHTAFALDRTLGGRPATAMRGAGSWEEHAANGLSYNSFRASSRERIENQLLRAGDGARGLVSARRANGLPGHQFNAVNQHGHVIFLDGQRGLRVPRVVVERLANYSELYFRRTY
jgi:hypothetical protein